MLLINNHAINSSSSRLTREYHLRLSTPPSGSSHFCARQNEGIKTLYDDVSVTFLLFHFLLDIILSHSSFHGLIIGDKAKPHKKKHNKITDDETINKRQKTHTKSIKKERVERVKATKKSENDFEKFFSSTQSSCCL